VAYTKDGFYLRPTEGTDSICRVMINVKLVSLLALIQSLLYKSFLTLAPTPIIEIFGEQVTSRKVVEKLGLNG
jgi:hypothetical protein